METPEPPAAGGNRGNLKEKVPAVNDLVPYQEGSIANRMLVFKEAGTITLFAFEAGEGLPGTLHRTTPCSR